MVYVMSEKIKLYNKGDCVQISHWGGCDEMGFFHCTQSIGLVLEAELIEMGDNEQMNMRDEKEWMYRVILPSGEINEVWDYEIKHVNTLSEEYNNLSRKPEGV